MRKAVFDMKRILCIILAAAMLVSLLTLTSCAGKEGGTKKPELTETDKPATTPETEGGEPVPDADVNERAQLFLDEAPCYTHNWVHMQFGASSTLTEEALGEAILKWCGIPEGFEVVFDKDSFDAFHESYQAEGDGSSAGGYIDFQIKNVSTGETSDTVSVYFYIEKNLEREDYEFTVCPDEAE